MCEIVTHFTSSEIVTLVSEKERISADVVKAPRIEGNERVMRGPYGIRSHWVKGKRNV